MCLCDERRKEKEKKRELRGGVEGRMEERGLGDGEEAEWARQQRGIDSIGCTGKIPYTVLFFFAMYMMMLL